MPEYADVPAAVLARLRAICLALPEAHEEQAWAGIRWCIRKRNFAHVITVETPAYERAAAAVTAGGPATVLTFRSTGPELEVLAHAGHPFFKPRWNPEVVGMVIDDDTDWDEVTELLTDSFCMLAPKKVAALVDRPEPEG